MSGSGLQGRNWVLAAMIFAVAPSVFADFAHATSVVLSVMCGVMAFAGVVALLGLERGRQEESSFEVAEAPLTATGPV